MAKAENVVKGSFRNIIDSYNNASESSIAEGTAWYTDAHNIALQVSTLLGTDDVRVGAGIISALSPQIDWGANIAEALKFASLGYSTKQTGANNLKAQRISEGEDPETVLGGNKVVPFYHAILDPYGDYLPVVDRHGLEIHYGKSVSKRDRNRAMSNSRVMKRIQTSYKLASKKLGLHYNVVQAVTWVQHRKDKGYTKEIAWETN
tara:strand:+ start:374 stop:988 length:615 start_codon:yes stop_codon:yes gene_type:complete